MKGVQKSPAMILILSIITCSIYSWYWIYSTGTELKNYLRDNEINPGLDLLLSILCFPYFYYVIYIYSKKIYKAEIDNGVVDAVDNSFVFLIIGIFLPTVAIMLMQYELNKVWNNQ